MRHVTRRFCLLVLALWTCGCATGPGRHAGGRNVLWSISDADSTVYLMGSVHALPRSVYPLDRALDRAFDASPRVVFELDLARHSERELSRALEREAKYPPGDSIRRHVSPETLALLEQILAALGIELGKLERYRPWFISDALTVLWLEAEGIRAEYGVDAHFFRKAMRNGKVIAGLETPGVQAGIYRGMTDAEAEAYLLGGLVQLPRTVEMLEDLARAWRRGRIDQLDDLLNTLGEADPKLNDAMFVTRNQRWLPRIERMLALRENVLVIVGAGHLVGRDGIIESLRKRGYPILRL